MYGHQIILNAVGESINVHAEYLGYVHRKIKVDRFGWGNPENVSFQAVKKAHDTIRHDKKCI